MNKPKLALHLRCMATEIYEKDVKENGGSTPTVADVAELLRVLARLLEGKTPEKAFGAPGDWGYGTPIGDALAERSLPNQEAP